MKYIALTNENNQNMALGVSNTCAEWKAYALLVL